jgi:hypothetical protein
MSDKTKPINYTLGYSLEGFEEIWHERDPKTKVEEDDEVN